MFSILMARVTRRAKKNRMLYCNGIASLLLHLKSNQINKIKLER